MKPIVDNSRTVTSNMDGEAIKFGFDSGSIVHLQSLLSNLYNDPIRAVVRELSINAIDSNVEANSDKPIEVTLPSALYPTFVVKDSGTGMSLDTLRMVYTNYGASTKRNSNDFVGMLGVGSKSPLAVADNFTIDTVHNGVRIIAVVRKDKAGAAEMVIIDSETTGAPNGTKLSVPASNMTAWATAANSTFKFFDADSVLVDGQAPEELGGIQLSEKIRLLPTGGMSYYNRNDYVVMGGVAYSAAKSLSSPQSEGMSVAYTADIGEFTFTPSREELMDSENNRVRLEAAQKEIKTAVAYFLDHSEEFFDSPEDALRAYTGCGGLAYRGLLTWHGEKLSPHIRLGNSSWEWDLRYSTKPRCRRIGGLDTSVQESRQVVVGYDSENSLTMTNRKKIRIYAENNGISANTRWVITDELGKSPVAKQIDVINWADIKATKIPSAAKSRKKASSGEAQWEVVIDGQSAMFDTRDLPDEAIVLSPVDYTSAHAELAKQFNKTIIVASKNRHARLGRLINVLPVSEFRTMFDGFVNRDLQLSYEVSLDNALMRLDPARIDDPDLARAISIGKLRGTPEYNQYRKTSDLFSVIGIYDRTEYENIRDTMRGYMLLYSYHIGSCSVDHITTYVNAIFNEGIK